MVITVYLEKVIFSGTIIDYDLSADEIRAIAEKVLSEYKDCARIVDVASSPPTTIFIEFSTTGNKYSDNVKSYREQFTDILKEIEAKAKEYKDFKAMQEVYERTNVGSDEIREIFERCGVEII